MAWILDFESNRSMYALCPDGCEGLSSSGGRAISFSLDSLEPNAFKKGSVLVTLTHYSASYGGRP